MKTIFIKFGFVLLLLLSACYNGHLDAVGMKKSTNTVLNAPDEKILNEGVDERALKLKRANDIFKNIIGNKGCITVEDLASLSADDRFFLLDYMEDLKKLGIKPQSCPLKIGENIKSMVIPVDAFNPENDFCSKKSTIDTWLSSYFKKDLSLFKNIQRWVYDMAIFGGVYEKIIPNKIPNTNFGSSFTSIPLESFFLEYIHNVSKKRAPKTITFAEGFGYVSPKVPLCYENEIGVHYMNDITKEAIDTALNEFWPKCSVDILHLVGKSLMIDCDDCFTFAIRHPDLVGKVDAIYVQNFEHFLSPKKHQQFLEVIFELLAPGGRAFLSAFTFGFGLDEKHLGYILYQENKKLGYVYPSYLLETVKFDRNEKNAFDKPEKFVFVDAERISQDLDNPIGYITYKEGELVNKIGDVEVGDKGLFDVLFQNYFNRFSPGVYRASIELFNKTHVKGDRLEVVDSFFITRKNEMVTKWTDGLHCAAAVVAKKKK